jgi:hypothetical protein
MLSGLAPERERVVDSHQSSFKAFHSCFDVSVQTLEEWHPGSVSVLM